MPRKTNKFSSLHAKAEKALQKAVRNVIADRKKTGDPLIVWKNGKVVRGASQENKTKWIRHGSMPRKGHGRPNLMMNDRWRKIKEFEIRHKRKFLRRMSEKESLDIFLDLYQSGQDLLDKKYYSILNLEKIKALTRIHSLARDIKQ